MAKVQRQNRSACAEQRHGSVLGLIAAALACDEHLRRATSLMLAATGCMTILLAGLGVVLSVIATDHRLLLISALAGSGGLAARIRAGRIGRRRQNQDTASSERFRTDD